MNFTQETTPRQGPARIAFHSKDKLKNKKNAVLFDC